MNSIIQEADQQFVSVYNRYPIILDCCGQAFL